MEAVDRLRGGSDLHGGIFTLRLLPLASLHALCFQICSHAGESLALVCQSLPFNLQIGGLLCDFEFLGVELEDLCRVVGWVVLRERVVVVCAQRLVGPGELRQRGFEGL